MAGLVPYNLSTGWMGHSEVHHPDRISNNDPITPATTAADISMIAVNVPSTFRPMRRMGTTTNSNIMLIRPNAAAPHSGILMFCAMPNFCGSI